MKTGYAQTTIQEMLTTRPPAFSDTRVSAIADDLYGISGETRLLVSERDQNFQLTAQDGRRYTLKISNHAEQQAVIDFQSEALLYVSKQDASLPVPRVIPTIEGQLYGRAKRAGNTHFIRMLSWLEGSVIHDATTGPELVGQMGQLLARLDVALKGFDHPGSNFPLLWDMKRADYLTDLIDHIEEADLRRLIDQTLAKFIAEVKPVLDTLRTQVIHNDMNPGNVLTDKGRPVHITGIIDFGDMTRSPLIIDLAVAAAYQLSDGDDPLAGALPMIAGYHAVEPLLDKEMELLTDLIRTRLITSLLIGSYRSTLFPENREYLLISQRSARNFLINLRNLQANEALARIREACHRA